MNPGDNPVRAYLVAHPLAVKAVKKAGLFADFKPFPDVLAKDGAGLDETMVVLRTEKLLPAAADYNDLLDALDHRGLAGPPPGAEGGATPPAPPASPASSPKEEKKETKSSNMKTSGVPDFTVKVVEVDPASLIPGKTPAEIEPSRVRGVQQRFPEGKGYPAVTAYEDKEGLHLIDGHHRTMVGKERGDTIKVVVVSANDYEALKAAGVGHVEMSYLMLAKAWQSDAMRHLEKQYPEKGLKA